MRGEKSDWELEQDRERRRHAVELVRRGGDVIDIAHELGFRPHDLTKLCQRAGLMVAKQTGTGGKAVIRSDGKRYRNAIEAAHDLGVTPNSVRCTARGVYGTCRGYGFRYA